MINAIRLPGLRNNEYAQFIQNFLSIVQRYDPAALLVQDEYDQLLSLSTSVKAMLNESNGSAVTDELVALDTRRDEAINGIIALVNGYTYSKDAAKKPPPTCWLLTWQALGPLHRMPTKAKPASCKK